MPEIRAAYQLRLYHSTTAPSGRAFGTAGFSVYPGRRANILPARPAIRSNIFLDRHIP